MSDYTAHADGTAGGQPRLAHAFRTMPGWKVKLLVSALILGVLGAGAQVASRMLRDRAPVVTTTTHVTPAAPSGVVPPGSSGFADNGGASTPPQTTTDTTVTTPAATPPTLTDQVTPYMTKFGFSFVVGLVVGVVFRTFLGFAAMITGLVIALALALSYFHVINLDLTAVRAQTGAATTWLSEQGGHLKDLLFAHLPSAGAAGAGFLVGMKRR